MTTSAPLKVLIVEDEPIIAMDIQFMVEDVGHEVAALAKSLQDAEKLDPDLAPDLAFVDIQLANDSCGLDVVALIKSRWEKTAEVFVTANPKKIPEDFAGAQGLIIKPFSEAGFTSAVRYVSELVRGEEGAMPSSFIPAPAAA